MRFKHNNRGFTLAEVVTATGIMVFLVASIVSIMMSLTFCYDRATNRVFTDTDADMAMQRIVSCVREAKHATPGNSGTSVLVNIPLQNADGTQDRRQTDPDCYFQFFLSDSTHVPGRTGTWLWKQTHTKTLDTYEVLRKDVASLVFELTDSTKSIQITVVTQNTSQGKSMRTELTDRVVYMRNN